MFSGFTFFYLTSFIIFDLIQTFYDALATLHESQKKLFYFFYLCTSLIDSGCCQFIDVA